MHGFRSAAAVLALLAFVALLVAPGARTAAPLVADNTTPPPPAIIPASPATTSPATTTITAATSAPIATTSIRKRAALPPARPQHTIISATTAPTSSAPAVHETTRPIPYSFPRLSASETNDRARAGLVNIFCVPTRGAGNGISGSGVVIDSRGVILTNAHVAQYVLLSKDSRISLSCMARTGAPATPQWNITVLYLPPVWVSAHAREIGTNVSYGTGDHDWALLYVTGARGGSARTPLPALPFDTREDINAQGDEILAASYPAEFVGGTVAQKDLYPVTSVTTIRQLLTFVSGTVDVLSLGGVIEAQGGSSGGAVVNAWGRLVGLITTTTEGKTTADRDLHAITISYIDRDIRAQTGLGLAQFLEGDLAAKANDFNANTAPDLVERFIAAMGR